MLEPYAAVDQNAIRKKEKAITMQPIGIASVNNVPSTTSVLPPSAVNTPIAPDADPTDKTSVMDKVGAIGTPLVEAGMSLGERSNMVAENTKQANAMTMKTTMDLAKAGGTIGSAFGPMGTVVGGAAGALTGIITGGIRAKHDKMVIKRAEQKKYAAGIVKTEAERDRDNRMADAQNALAAQKQLISTQLGLIG